MARTLNGKVAGTGGSRGIGAATALPLADEAPSGDQLQRLGRQGRAVVGELKAKGVQAKAFKADQAKAVEVDQLVKDVVKSSATSTSW